MFDASPWLRGGAAFWRTGQSEPLCKAQKTLTGFHENRMNVSNFGLGAVLPGVWRVSDLV
jgi:hypothetical protein